MLTQLSKSNKAQALPTQPIAMVSLDFDKGKNSREENDKIRFDEYDVALNVYFDRKNARVRPGTQTFTTDDTLLDIVIAKHSDGNKLFGIREDGLNAKVSKIDRDTAITTDLITGISGQESFSFASGGDTFYTCNGEDADIQVVKSDETTTTLAIPSGVPLALTICNERLWVADDSSSLHYSKKAAGEITEFTETSNHNTGGITTTGIDQIIALGTSSVYVVALGKNKIEVHSAPQFSGGETTFGTVPDTFIAGFAGYGIASPKAFEIVGGFLYFQSNGGFYRYLIGSQTPPEHLDRNKGEHRQLNFDATVMAYDPSRELLMSACGKTSSQNNYGVYYNIVESSDTRYNSFSNFDNIDVKSFAFDSDDMYYLQNYSGVIKTIEGTSDDGEAIDGELRSMNTFNGEVRFKKNAKQMYLDAESDGGDTLYYYFWVDTKDESTQSPSFSYEAIIPSVGGTLSCCMGPYGLTPWGLTGYDMSADTRTFKVWQSRKINKKYARGQCGVKFSTINNLQIRGIGWHFSRTVQRIGDKTFL